MKRRIASLAIFIVVAAAHLGGGFDSAERWLMDGRFRVLPHAATGDLVVVEIDAASLHELDSWPWPRRYHARLLEILLAAGAREVAFDVDFSSRSRAQDDAILADAFAAAGGRVILPAFRQTLPTAGGAERIIFTAPRPEFARSARLAAVNVVPGPDGLVRRAMVSNPWRDGRMPSMPALLAGDAAAAAEAGDFHVDFAIAPAGLPRLSFVDVLRRRFDPAAVSGKKVIVGATAPELGDQLPVPLTRSMAGVVFQALAYESLVQGRAIHRAPAAATLLMVLLITLLVGPRFAGWSWRRSIAVVALGSMAAAVLALVIQARFAISIDIAAVAAVLFLSAAHALVARLDAQSFRIFAQHMAMLHRRSMMNMVVENSSDGIILASHDGVIEVFNAAASGMFGRAQSDVAGQRLTDVFSGAEWERAAKWTPGELRELRGHRPDGESFPIEVLYGRSALKLSRNKLERRNDHRLVHIYTVRDITARKRVEEAQKTAMEEAVSANRAKTEFLTNMSHELRTPLNAIIGFSEMFCGEMLGPLGNDRYREYAGDIHASGIQLRDIINDILDMSKIEAGKFELRDGVVDAEAAITSCLRIVKGRARDRGVTLAVDLADTLPPLRGDERVFKQVLLNLLSNSIKFTEEGGSVTVSAGIDAGGGFVFAVADTGIGIAPEDLEKVMEPFAQVDGQLARKFEGTGLGLALSKTFVEHHGGALSLESELGRGTVATVRLPAARTVQRPVEGAEATAAVDTATSPAPTLVG